MCGAICRLILNARVNLHGFFHVSCFIHVLNFYRYKLTLFENYAVTLRYIVQRTDQIILPARENRDMRCIFLALFEKFKVWITFKTYIEL